MVQKYAIEKKSVAAQFHEKLVFSFKTLTGKTEEPAAVA